jgi:hypothetical protein
LALAVSAAFRARIATDRWCSARCSAALARWLAFLALRSSRVALVACAVAFLSLARSNAVARFAFAASFAAVSAALFAIVAAAVAFALATVAACASAVALVAASLASFA